MSRSAANKVVSTLAKALEKSADDDDETAEGLSDSPLFGGLSGDGRQRLSEISVIRIGPVPEGQVGKIQPNDTEGEIERRWGGGKYRLIGRDERGKPIKGAFETIELAGEPRLKTKGARLEYRRQLADLGDDDTAKSGAEPFGVAQVLVLLTRQESDRRAEWERRQEAEQKRHERDLERLRLEAQERERMREADRARDREERRIEDERRVREAADRDVRERKFAEESRARDREWYQSMLRMQHEKPREAKDPTDTLMKGIDLALKLRPPGEDADASTEIIRQIPGMLKQGGEMVQAALARQPAAAPAPALAPQPAPTVARGTPTTPAPAPAPAGKPDDPTEVVFSGELGLAVQKAVAALVSAGIEPEQALQQVFAGMAERAAERARAAEPKPAAPPAPASPTPAAPPPAPPVDGSSALPIPNAQHPTAPRSSATETAKSATP